MIDAGLLEGFLLGEGQSGAVTGGESGGIALNVGGKAPGYRLP